MDGKNYDAKCGRSCVPVAIACDGQCPCAVSGLRWYMTCGDPVCRADSDPFDDPSIPNCAGQKLGESCQKQGELCDGVAGCGAKWICAASDPTTNPGGCPISRARFKEQVEYLDAAQRRSYRDQLLRMPLASYHYRHAPEAGPQLGFMIDDVEPSVAVSGDHVNMYGYLSMAVAAIQEQQQQIEALQRELEQLRANASSGAQAASCGP
jgi:hypothetical protein